MLGFLRQIFNKNSKVYIEGYKKASEDFTHTLNTAEFYKNAQDATISGAKISFATLLGVPVYTKVLTMAAQIYAASVPASILFGPATYSMQLSGAILYTALRYPYKAFYGTLGFSTLVGITIEGEKPVTSVSNLYQATYKLTANSFDYAYNKLGAVVAMEREMEEPYTYIKNNIKNILETNDDTEDPSNDTDLLITNYDTRDDSTDTDLTSSSLLIGATEEL